MSKRPPEIIVQLIHIQGPMKGQIQEFGEPIISIGRHPSCHLHFPPDLAIISRKHAEIVREGNQFKLIDHSANGTFVNGKKVKEVLLKNGDVLTFAEGGPKVSFLTQMREIQTEAEIVPAAPPIVETPLPPSQVSPKVHQEPGQPKPIRPRLEKPAPSQPVSVPPGFQPRAEVSDRNVKAPLIIQYGPTLRSYKEVPVTIGKSPNCDFVLDHPAIYDHHAQIFFTQNQYWVKDLTGQRTILINRQPVGLQAPLNLDDNLALSPKGPVFQFLGEGRLVEVTEPVEEGPGPEPPKKEEETGRKGKRTSALKKFLRR